MARYTHKLKKYISYWTRENCSKTQIQIRIGKLLEGKLYVIVLKHDTLKRKRVYIYKYKVHEVFVSSQMY